MCYGTDDLLPRFPPAFIRNVERDFGISICELNLKNTAARYRVVVKCKPSECCDKWTQISDIEIFNCFVMWLSSCEWLPSITNLYIHIKQTLLIDPFDFTPEVILVISYMYE